MESSVEGAAPMFTPQSVARQTGPFSGSLEGPQEQVCPLSLLPPSAGENLRLLSHMSSIPQVGVAKGGPPTN